MKRKISTAVLFVLLVLTVVAINKTDMQQPTAIGNTGAGKHQTN